MDETDSSDSDSSPGRSALDLPEQEIQALELVEAFIPNGEDTMFQKGLSKLRSLDGIKMKIAKLVVGYLLCEMLTYSVLFIRLYIDLYPGIFSLIAIFCLVTGSLNTLVTFTVSENPGDYVPLAVPVASAFIGAGIDFCNTGTAPLFSYYELLYSKIFIIVGTIFLIQCTFAEGTDINSPKAQKVRYVLNYTTFYVTLFNFIGRFLFHYFFRTITPGQEFSTFGPENMAAFDGSFGNGIAQLNGERSDLFWGSNELLTVANEPQFIALSTGMCANTWNATCSLYGNDVTF